MLSWTKLSIFWFDYKINSILKSLNKNTLRPYNNFVNNSNYQSQNLLEFSKYFTKCIKIISTAVETFLNCTIPIIQNVSTNLSGLYNVKRTLK